MNGLQITELGLESIRDLLQGKNPDENCIKYIAVGADNSLFEPSMTALKDEIHRDEAEFSIVDFGTLVCSIEIPETSNIDGKAIGEIGIFNEKGLIARETLDPKIFKNPGEKKIIKVYISLNGLI